jgi:glucose-6-phosphate isomerase
MITLNTDYLKGFVSADEIKRIFPLVRLAHEKLHNREGLGAEFTGWLDLPSRTSDALIKEISSLGREVQKNSDCIVSIGIGGSYLGIRATVDFLGAAKLPVHYAGHNVSSDYLHQLLITLKSKRITAVVISKSDTTTEPAIALRVVKKFLESKYKGKELTSRIICVTDERKGALRNIATEEGYRSFVIPDDVGGRYSVLTPVGLVPLGLAGIDIRSLMEGARKAEEEYTICDLGQNACYRYAALRNILYGKDKKIEVLSSFYPNVFYVAEWFKQLFGESEGKQGKGIFPASLMMSTDLHSMGQWMQEAERTVFETFLEIEKPLHDVTIPQDKENLDGFNYVAGKGFDFVSKKAYAATAAAHFEGGVPNMTITLCKADAMHLGHLYYFFEKACGISGYILGVNPFDQPGVETYKKKMFALLGKR